MTETVILVEVDVVSPAGAATTLRFCDRGMRPFPPTDGMRANLVWEDRLAEAPVYRRALFDDITSLTPGRAGGGMTLKNADSYLDAYRAHAWNTIRVWRWPVGQPFSAAVEVLHGLCAIPAYNRPSGSPATVRVDLYDDLAELDEGAQSVRFTGANDGVTVFYEGSAGGLKDQPKPFAYGDLTDAHLPAILVNPGQLVHQLGDGPLQGSVAIFDGGVAAGYAADGDLADAAFDAATPAAAHYATNLNRGLVKITADPVMALTFGVKGSSSPTYVETAGPVAARLLARARVPAERIGASVAALASTAVVGVFSAQEVTTRELIGRLGRSALAAIQPDRKGAYQAIPFAAPRGAPVVTLEADHILSIDEADGGSAPVGEFRVGWGRIFTTFAANDLKASIRDTEAATRLKDEYRYVVEPDAATKARFPRSFQTLTIDTDLRSEADARALALKLKALFGMRTDGKARRQLNLTVSPVLDDLVADIGDEIRVNDPARSVVDNFILIAEQPMRPRRDQAIWTVWG